MGANVLAEISDLTARLADLRERVDGFRAWAASRIEECRKQEAKFSSASDAFITAQQERRTLEAVLRQLEGT